MFRLSSNSQDLPFHWKPISSRRSILPCERLQFVFIPFWIFLYSFLMSLHQCPNDGLFAYLLGTLRCPNLLLFECYQIATTLLECIIVVGTLPLEANLFETLYSALRKIAMCLYSLLDFLVCCSHAVTPISQSWIVCIVPIRKIAMSKLIFKSKELIAPFVKTCV